MANVLGVFAHVDTTLDAIRKLREKGYSDLTVYTPVPIEEALVDVRLALFRQLPSQRRGLGRNDPCWCGSGEKLKKCHGQLP